MKSNLKYPYSPPSEGGTSTAHTTPETKLLPLAMADEHVPIIPIAPTIPRAIHAIRRNRSPPRNERNEMFCDHVNCQGKSQTFKRVCEWNKHMDRHERPYKCREPGCELNLGFTYSGGLLRHQREVHRMHLSTKQPLYCPFPNCNRSSGTGFTRRENLEEHKRRRHLEELSGRPSRRGSYSSSPVPTDHRPDSAAPALSRQPSSKRRRLSGAESSPSARQQEIKPRVATIPGLASEGRNPPADAESSDLVQFLRAEIRQRDDVIRRQAHDLQRLQGLFRDLPAQHIYGVTGVLQPGMPPGGGGGTRA